MAGRADPPADRSLSEVDPQVDALLSATRALVAIAARSLAPDDDVVTLSQWRVLVVIAESGSATLSQVATGLGVHASTATRLCDRLTATGLISRREDAADRRYLSLTLTRKGQRLLDRVIGRRRTELAAVLDRMEPQQRTLVVAAFTQFAQIAGAPDSDPVWSAIAAQG